MLIVLFVISVLLIILGIYLAVTNSSLEDVGIASGVVGFLICVIVSITSLVAITKVVSANTVQKKIVLYETENEAIEQEVKTIIDAYIEYEEGVYGSINIDDYNGNLLLLTQLYPELKASTLIQTQLDLHMNNTTEIKKLKEQLLNIDVWAWWLYFKPVGE